MYTYKENQGQNSPSLTPIIYISHIFAWHSDTPSEVRCENVTDTRHTVGVRTARSLKVYSLCRTDGNGPEKSEYYILHDKGNGLRLYLASLCLRIQADDRVYTRVHIHSYGRREPHACSGARPERGDTIVVGPILIVHIKIVYVR